MRNLVRKSLASLLVFCCVPSQLLTTTNVVSCRYHNLFILWSILIKSYPFHWSSLYSRHSAERRKLQLKQYVLNVIFSFSRSTRSPFRLRLLHFDSYKLSNSLIFDSSRVSISSKSSLLISKSQMQKSLDYKISFLFSMPFTDPNIENQCDKYLKFYVFFFLCFIRWHYVFLSILHLQKNCTYENCTSDLFNLSFDS